MRELTYISPNVPLAISHYVHGMWQRQQLFIDALAPLFDRVHCVFWKGLYPDDGLAPSAIADKAAGAFGKEVRLTLLQPARPNPSPGHFDYYLKSIFLGPERQGYRRVIGDAEVQQLNACLPEKPDAVFAHGLEAMVAVARLPRPLPLKLWDAGDLEFIKFVRSLKSVPWTIGKPLMYLQVLGLFRQERKCGRAATLSFVCSDVDKQRANTYFGGHFETAPNAVRVPDTVLPPPQGAPTLLFVGFLGYEPNQDAADWFIEEIWPLVANEIPEARLLVAGARPDLLRASRRTTAGVELLGFVPDLQDIYSSAHVVICPIRSGSGTRVKLLDAAAYARPVVSTRVGAEGIDFEEGRNALLVDDAAGFARACTSLLRDRARAVEMGKHGWQLAKARYAREAVIEGIRRHLRRELGETERDVGRSGQ